MTTLDLLEDLKEVLNGFAYDYRYAENDRARILADRHAIDFLDEVSIGLDEAYRQKFTCEGLLHYFRAKKGNDWEYPRPEEKSFFVY